MLKRIIRSKVFGMSYLSTSRSPPARHPRNQQVPQ